MKDFIKWFVEEEHPVLIRLIWAIGIIVIVMVFWDWNFIWNIE